jgi:RNA polymerase sigma factor (sigma-70 family)
MRLAARRYDLDLERLADEELVVLAQECGYGPASTALLLRYHDWAGRLVTAHARRSRLQAADVEDARQNAVFSLTEAIRRYDTLELGRRGGCRFRTFLYRVVTARYCDFARQVGRLVSRWKGSLLVGDALTLARCNWGDPATAAELREAQARLEQALARLDGSARLLWERLASGIPLRAVALEQGISYDAAKRARRRLLAELTAHLRGVPAPPEGGGPLG